MTLLGLLGFVYAAEVIISPLASDFDKPVKTFSEISSPTPVVLGVAYDSSTQNTVIQIPTPTPTAKPTPTPLSSPTTSPLSPTPTPNSRAYSLKKDRVTIALLGDSMIDTLGPDVPELSNALKQYYPDLKPTMLNYGVGATNIDYGLERITHDYDYLGRHIPALATTHPDVVVVESFGYNPYSFDTGALDKHWMALSHIIDTLKQSLPNAKIIIAATIAPHAAVFGDGAAGLSFTPYQKAEKVNIIKSYLESTTRFATGQHIPLADAYHSSLKSDGNGTLSYINAGDHIHTSPEGRKFFSEILAKTFVDNKILE